MKLDQETIEWIKDHKNIITDLITAERLVTHGKIVLFFQDGKYLGMDACPRERIRN